MSAILLQPFMPSKAGEVLDVLGVGEGRRGFVDAVLGGDLGYGRRLGGGQKLGKGKGKGKFGGIFPPLAVEE